MMDMLELNKIYNMNCLEGMKQLDDDSIDLVISSPPYAGATMWNKDIDDNIKQLTKLNLDVLKEVYKKLKNGGVCCWNIQDIPFGNHGIILTTTTTTLEATKNIGFNLRGHIIWDKGVPHLPAPCFMRRPVVLNHVFESILVLFKGDWIPREKKITLSTKEKGWVARNIWKMRTESAKNMNHIAPYPEILVERCIRLFSFDNDIILDPFMGSGTTAVVCQKLNRNFIGFEINSEYCKLAEKRLNKIPKRLTKFIDIR